MAGLLVGLELAFKFASLSSTMEAIRAEAGQEPAAQHSQPESGFLGGE